MSLGTILLVQLMLITSAIREPEIPMITEIRECWVERVSKQHQDPSQDLRWYERASCDNLRKKYDGQD